jgi:hypothetical protein
LRLLDCAIGRKDKIACLKREMAYRERFYPIWVAGGRMLASEADRELAVIKAILKDYEASS